ncbi:MAG TPA: hypothetical protein HA257_05490 [Candidatus Methanoperedenaceae archaeon]|nr:hypothetical protein [Candidatus Methanoperedenaceae archaeon]
MPIIGSNISLNRFIIILILLPWLSGGGSAATDIGDCTTIASPGEYVLNRSIRLPNSSLMTPCITITASDVILDGRGYAIDGAGSFLTGISTNFTNNVTLRNIYLTNLSTGMSLFLSTNSTVNNITASNNRDTGVELVSSSKNNLTYNVITHNANGLILRNSNYNWFTGNNIDRNGNGTMLVGTTSNRFMNNTARLNTYQDIQIKDSIGSSNRIEYLFIDPVVSLFGNDISVKSASSPAPPPSGRRSLNKYVNVTALGINASYLYFYVHYTDAEVAGINESGLRMWRYDGASWSMWGGTNGVDVGNNFVYANVTGSGVFAPMAAPGHELALAALGILVAAGMRLRIHQMMSRK